MHTSHSNTQYKNESSTVKWAQWDKTQSRELLVCSCVCIALCTIVAHNIAQNRPDSFPPYPPDNHHISGDVYLREGGSTGNRNNIEIFLYSWRALLPVLRAGRARACYTIELHEFYVSLIIFRCCVRIITRSPAIAEGPRDAGVPVEIW